MPRRKLTAYWILVFCYTHACPGIQVEVRGQLVGINSSLPSCGSQGSNSSSQTWMQIVLPVSLMSLAPLKLLLLLFYLRYWIETYCWFSQYIFYIYLLLVLERTTTAMFPWRGKGRNVFGFFILSLAHHSAQESFAKYSLKSGWER